MNAVGGGRIVLDVKGSTFTTQPTGVNAQNGILFWNRGESVTGTVDGVTIRGVQYLGTSAAASAIINYGTANLTEVRNSTFETIDRYISNETANEIDARQNNTFDGVLGETADGDQLATISGKVRDQNDNPALGLVLLQ